MTTLSYRMVLGLLAGLTLTAGCGTQGLPKVVYLARHGQTEWNRISRWQGDPDLDQVGYINRVSLWHLLKDKPIAAVYTSERLRTRRTADLTARQHGLKIQQRAALNEINSGIGEGICFAQMAPHLARPGQLEACKVKATHSHPEVTLEVIQRLFKEGQGDRLTGKLPLGESLQDLVGKTETFVDELRRGYNERQVLVVGHGVINRALLHHLMGWKIRRLTHLRQNNDQVYRLEFSGRGEAKLWLYTPGHGWKRCQKPPAEGDRRLPCDPLKGEGEAHGQPPAKAEPPAAEPKPAEPKPAAETTPAPAEEKPAEPQPTGEDTPTAAQPETAPKPAQ